MSAPIDVYLTRHGQNMAVGSLWPQATGCVFSYAATWLEHGFAIDPFLPLVAGNQYTHRPLFGAFADTLPDRWGRSVWRARFGKAASDEELLKAVPDAWRMGALRLDGAVTASHELPSLDRLAELAAACKRIHEGNAKGIDLDLVWAGIGMGGAYPKALVSLDGGRVGLAKIGLGSLGESAQWEWVCVQLARECQIETTTCVLAHRPGACALVSERFDRNENERIPYWSANTLLNDPTQSTYEALLLQGWALGASSLTLWRRMVFNFLIGNEDDHLRNHGLVRKNERWDWAPAFDMTPTPSRYRTGKHALPMSENGSSLAIACDLAQMVELDASQARNDITHMQEVIAQRWRPLARLARLGGAEARVMQDNFEQA